MIDDDEAKRRREHWAQVHITSDRSKPLDFLRRRGPDRIIGHGSRVESKALPQ